MQKRLFLTIGLAFLAGCAVAEKPELALACQTRACTCIPATAGYPFKVEPAPVQWKSNGDAYCAEGYVLRLVEK